MKFKLSAKTHLIQKKKMVEKLAYLLQLQLTSVRMSLRREILTRLQLLLMNVLEEHQGNKI